jgi:hypothetical protein
VFRYRALKFPSISKCLLISVAKIISRIIRRISVQSSTYRPSKILESSWLRILNVFAQCMFSSTL